MNLEFFSQNPELLWIFTVFYDLTLAIILFYFFGKNGLYTAVILGIILANLQGGKVSELTIFGNTFVVSMGAIMYSGIYFATDLLNEKYGRAEANRAVIIGAVANVIVMFTLVLSTYYLQSDQGASIVFHDPRPAADVIVPRKKEKNTYNSSLLSYASRTNRAIFFPAWLPHWVQQNKSNNKRISIAWNMQVKGQVGEHHEFQSANF